MAKRMVKKALAAAVVAGLAAQSAEAVYVNPDGHGSALIYQYYTVQNVGGTPQDTLISVVNTTNVSKAVKVRFREGKASQEVLDFLVLLSPYDVWSAAVTANGSSETSGAKIITADTSCVWPRAIGGVVPGSGSGVAFKNLAYVGDAAKDNAIARTREGYIELLEAATIVPGSDLDVAITHVNGVPASCADAIDILNEVDGDVFELSSADVTGPNGGLTGKASIVNVLGGSEIGYNAVALGAFRTPDSGVMSTAFGTVTGALRDADPVTTVFGRNVSRSPLDPTNTSGVGGALTAMHVGWNNSADQYDVDAGALAVTAALMRDSVMNEYSIGAFSKANTDWVMTFPTKSYFVPSSGGAPSAPFTQALTSTGACEPFQFEYWDREERQIKITEEYDFSPLPEVEKEILTACWESTILTFYTQDTPQAHQPGAGGAAITASGVLGSKNISGIPLAATYDFGWARLTFGELDDEGVLVKPSLVANGQCFLVDTDPFVAGSTPQGAAPLSAGFCPDAPTFYGLPVVGFMVQSFNNGTLTCGAQACKSSYGQAFNHNYTHSYDFAAFRNN